ncbi:hypothetical protein CSKR_104191 [Clonorchis sinensis]|uniref:Uncharacterized protein n=1 Tax=Clonorchis sinensis TaxID=79923 RepID=A0A3R7FEB7_CLOSI|nr:hypothetical protein CSKR_104191 [Clonorchis sinensis]
MIIAVKEARSPDIPPPKCSWVVRIEKKWWTGIRELYTGSLIDENWVLTVGNCCPEMNQTLYSYRVLLSASCVNTWSNDIGLVELATPLASPDGTFRFVRLPKSKKAGSKLKSGLFKGFKNSYLFEKSAKEERTFKMTVFAPIICPAFYWPERRQRGFCAGAPIEAQFTPYRIEIQVRHGFGGSGERKKAFVAELLISETPT